MRLSNQRRPAPLTDGDAARLKPSNKLGRVALRAGGSDTATLLLYGEIGYDITFPGVMQALAAIGDVSTLDIRLCSIGGYVSDGWAIYNALARHPATKVVTVEGLAASMASIIAMVGDTIIMPNNSYLMIHNPYSVAVGDADDMRAAADLLDHMQGVAAQVYADRSGQPLDVVQNMMDAETYLDAEQAVALGFADQVEQPLKVAASMDLSRLPAMPAAMRAALIKETKMAKTDDKPTDTPVDGAPVTSPSAPPATDAPAHTDDGEPGALPVDAPDDRRPNPPASPGFGPADPIALAEACAKAGFPELTVGLLRAKASMSAVQADIVRAQEITQVGKATAAAQMVAPAIAGGVSLETFRAMVFAGKAEGEPQIDTARPADKPAAKVEPIDTKGVFARMAEQREARAQSARRH